jgi:hypothetical protein
LVRVRWLGIIKNPWTGSTMNMFWTNRP